MADIATIWSPADGVGDWAVGTAGDLAQGDDLYTALLISIFSDAEASDDDVIPDGTSDRRGWWAGPIGSKLWLRERAKATPNLPAQIKNDIEQATAWMISDGVAATINITVAYETTTMIGATVKVLRRDGTRAALRFSRLWESI